MTFNIFDRGFSSSPELGIWEVYIIPQGCQNMSVSSAVAGPFVVLPVTDYIFLVKKYNTGTPDKSTSSNSPSNQI